MNKNKIILNGYLLVKIMEKYRKNMQLICMNKKYTIKINPKSFLVDFSCGYNINGIWVMSDNTCSYIDLLERKAEDDCLEKISSKERYLEVNFRNSKIYININSLLVIEIDNKNTEEFIKFVNDIDCENPSKDLFTYISKSANFFKDNNIKREGYWFEIVRNVAKMMLDIDCLELDQEIIKEFEKKLVIDKDNDLFEKTKADKKSFENRLNELKPKEIVFSTYTDLLTVLLTEKEKYNYGEKNYGIDAKYIFSNIYTNNKVITEIINDNVGFYCYIKNTDIIDQLYEDAIVLTTKEEDVELEYSVEKTDFEDKFVKRSFYDCKLGNKELEEEKFVNFDYGSREKILSIEQDTLSWGYNVRRGYIKDETKGQVFFTNIYKYKEKFLAKLKDLNIYLHNLDPKMFITIFHAYGCLIVESFRPQKDLSFVDYGMVKPTESKYKIEVPQWYYEQEEEWRRLEREEEASFWRSLDDYERENLYNMMEK